MNNIPFTQYMLPRGERRPTSIDVDDEAFAAWKRVNDAGFRMTVELLRTGMVSMCIEDPEFGDFDCVVTPNGPNVPVKLKEMLLRFNADSAAAWRKLNDGILA